MYHSSGEFFSVLYKKEYISGSVTIYYIQWNKL